jgi:hypothetical protein
MILFSHNSPNCLLRLGTSFCRNSLIHKTVIYDLFLVYALLGTVEEFLRCPNLQQSRNFIYRIQHRNILQHHHHNLRTFSSNSTENLSLSLSLISPSLRCTGSLLLPVCMYILLSPRTFARIHCFGTSATSCNNAIPPPSE